MAEPTLKTAVVGMGPQGKRILQVIPRIPELRLVAVADQNPKAMDGLSLPDDCSRAESMDHLLAAHPDVDVFVIATTAPSHAELALAAMGRGAKRVMLEKPMACSVAECLQVEEAARKNGVRLCVNHGIRYDPTHVWLKERIASGTWGAVRSVYVQRPGIGLGLSGSHSIDQITYLLGRPVQAVTGWIDTPKKKNPRGEQFRDPGGLVILDYGDEIKGVVVQNEDGAGPISVEINLQRARIRIDEKLDDIQVLERDMTVPRKPNQQAVYNRVPPPEKLVVRQDLYLLTESVLRELVGDRDMRCEARAGREVLEALTAAYLSDEAGHAPVRPSGLTSSQRRRALAIT